MGPVLTNSKVAYPLAVDSSNPLTAGGLAERWPASINMAFAQAPDFKNAQASTWKLAHTHYENFSVVSALLPRHLRQDFCNVYAFCRMADDLADEVADRDQSLRLLGRFRQQTVDLFAGHASTIMFKALESTVAKYDIPIQPFLDLIDAFEQDQRIDRYQTFEQLNDYCRRSANPVGRLVLYMSGYRDLQRQQLSDATCTALQLTNFWQDVRRDITDRNRIYLPLESMERFKVTEHQLQSATCDANYRNCIHFEVDRADALFIKGDVLLPLLNDQIRPQISLFAQGGKAVLSAVRRANYDTLSYRPVLSRWQKSHLIMKALVGKITQVVGHGPSVGRDLKAGR